MSRCLLTGATGFLGRQLTKGLLMQGHELVVVIRNPGSRHSRNMLEAWEEVIAQSDNGASIEVWQGDLMSEGSGGVFASRPLKDFDDVFHLAAVYDLSAPEATVLGTNVKGTERILEALSSAGFQGRFHMVSSIAVAGDYCGEFREDMFDEGQKHPHVYHRSKYESEAIARSFRDNHGIDVRIYRPGAIVGDSRTGEIDKIDGPYYMFVLVSILKSWIPQRVPIVLPKLAASLEIVPVDYVVDAILALRQVQVLEEQYCFHLTGSAHLPLHRTFKHILRAADGPKVGLNFPLGFAGLSASIWQQFAMAKQLKAIQLLFDGVLSKLGIPTSVFDALMPSVRFSSSVTQARLEQMGVEVPDFEEYVDVLWDYYNRHLDPAKNREQRASKALSGKLVLITGGSSGIGYESAKRALNYGARIILVARRLDTLQACRTSLSELCDVSEDRIDIQACDISDLAACDSLVNYVEETYGVLDVLFSNAGRSIRRSLSRSQGRFHDLERTMQLNYFGASRLILGLLPLMVKSGGGHILHSSSMGTLAVTPRFGPYMASKAAMDALCDSIAAEFIDRNIKVTSIKFPLVKTGMVAPTKEYKDADLVSPEVAAQMFIDAVIDEPRKQVTGMGVFLGSMTLFAPELVTRIYNYLYQIWPDEKGDFPDMSLDRALLTSFVPNSPL